MPFKEVLFHDYNELLLFYNEFGARVSLCFISSEIVLYLEEIAILAESALFKRVRFFHLLTNSR